MTRLQKNIISILTSAVVVVFAMWGYMLLSPQEQPAVVARQQPTSSPPTAAYRPAETSTLTATPPPSTTTPTPTATPTATPSPAPTSTLTPPPLTATSTPASVLEIGSPFAPEHVIVVGQPPDAQSGDVVSSADLGQQPARLAIPAIGVAAPVVPVGLEPSGIMAAPAQAHEVGWYQYGARPGEASNAVLAGHLDWWGKIGAFARLSEVAPGDVIEVQSNNGDTYRYVVESAQAYPNDTAPVAEIFGPTAAPTLTLITCAGAYDATRQVYQDRLVVRARKEE
jgi:LPXTG-site transpeptidase (sortase) family protein